MRRRAILRVLSAAPAVTLAGCVGRRSAPGDDGATTSTTTTTGETTSTTANPTTSTDGTTRATTTTGDATRTATTTSDATRTTTTADDTPTTTTPTTATTPDPPLAPGVESRTMTSEGNCLSDPGSVGGHSVDRRGDRAVITGSFRTSVPCYVARVGESECEDGVYRVVVGVVRETEDGDPTVCVQCVGRVDYELVVTFSESPDDVVVEHAGAEK